MELNSSLFSQIMEFSGNSLNVSQDLTHRIIYYSAINLFIASIVETVIALFMYLKQWL